MKVCLFSLAGLLVFTYAGLSIGHAASAGDLKKAQAEAESEGYIFELSHDPIVAKAKKNGVDCGVTFPRIRRPSTSWPRRSNPNIHS